MNTSFTRSTVESAALRDALPAKLISGALRLKDGEHFIGRITIVETGSLS